MMAVTIGKFLERLEASGILDEVALAGVRAKADDFDADADWFVKTLHKAGDITDFDDRRDFDLAPERCGRRGENGEPARLSSRSA